MKKMMRKILKITAIVCLFLLATAYFTGSALLVRQHEPQIVCTHIRIDIADSSVNRLVLPQDIYVVLEKNRIMPPGMKLADINLHQLEQLLLKENGIKECHVYTRIDGELSMEISLRTPLMRLETTEGGYYLDDSGALFPVTPYRTAYVPVVSGNIPIKQEEWLAQLYDFGCYIRGHRFWNAQIEQLYVHEPHNIEIIQRIGHQTVMMGDLSLFEYKLQKLYTFYRTVAAAQGWDRYSLIDIRFGDQIVCRP